MAGNLLIYSHDSVKRKATLVSAHDLGGANQLLYATRNKRHYHYALTGPALHVAKTLLLPNILNLDSINLDEYSHVLVSSNLEEQFSDALMIAALSTREIRVTGYLDHWVNFGSRWKQTPHKVIVSDLRAYFAALPHFGSRVRLNRNHYLLALKQSKQAILSATAIDEGQSALVILQPKGKEYRHQETLSSCFCLYTSQFLEQNFVHHLTLRSHVDTDAIHCSEYLKGKFPQVTFVVSDWSSSLEGDLVRASFVIGLDSYALFIANKLGKKVLSLGERRSKFSPKYPIL